MDIQLTHLNFIVTLPNRVQILFDFAVQLAEREFVAPGELAGILILDNQGKDHYMITELPALEQKLAYAKLIQTVSTSIGAVALVQLAECWMAPNQDGEPSPTEHPDRREVVMVALTFRQGERLYACVSFRPIERDPAGQVTGLGAELDGGRALTPHPAKTEAASAN